MVGPFIRKIVVEIGKALGKAVIAGVGLELAKVASDRVRRKFGAKPDGKKDAKDAVPLTPEEELKRAKAENEQLRAELERVKSGGSNTADAAVVEDDVISGD